MKYSPKLKKAMEEIKEIMEKHDIAGAVFLHTPGFGEQHMKVDPSYSCAFWEYKPGQEGIRIRTRLQEDYQGDKQKRNDAIRDTVNMFDILSNMMGPYAVATIQMMEQLEQVVNFTSSGSGFSSRNEQEN